MTCASYGRTRVYHTMSEQTINNNLQLIVFTPIQHQPANTTCNTTPNTHPTHPRGPLTSSPQTTNAVHMERSVYAAS